MFPRASGNFDLDLAKYKSYFLVTNTVISLPSLAEYAYLRTQNYPYL